MAWIDTYTAPILQRFNAALSTFNFTALDIYAMQQLCGASDHDYAVSNILILYCIGYETVIKNSSDFCGAFESNDWLGFEYANDLMYWYSLGYVHRYYQHWVMN